MVCSVPAAAVSAAVKVAAGLGVTSTEPVVLADGANVIVHLLPSPVVAKVAASTPEVRRDSTAGLQRELDVAVFLAGAGVPVLHPSAEMPATTYAGDGHVMSFWRYLRSSGDSYPDEATIGAMLRDLHAALRSYPGTVTALAPLADIPAYLARPQTRVSTGQAAALVAYGSPVDAGQLAVCEQLRRLHLTIWYGLYAERFPDLRVRADELLALWPLPLTSGRRKQDLRARTTGRSDKDLDLDARR